MMKKGKLLFMSFLLFFVVLFAAGFYSFNDVQVESTYILNDENIIEKNGEYFLVIDDRELSLPVNLYENINMDQFKEYKIRYVYNRLLNNDGEVVMVKRYGEQPWGK